MPTNTYNRRDFLKKDFLRAPFLSNIDHKSANESNFIPPFSPQHLEEVPHSESTFNFNGTLLPYSGPWGKEQAAHLLRRCCFGVKKSDLDLFMTMDMNEAVDYLLRLTTVVPEAPVNDYNNPDFEDPDIAIGADWTNATYNGDAEGYRVQSWRGWWLKQMYGQEASIVERMTLFWHNHFSTQTEIVYWGQSVYKHNVKLRANALGNFKELTKIVTTDGTMLYYLNGYLNSKGSPDENYARELQELFTVGKDSAQQYSEEDVVAAARVLTGWKINFDQYGTYHDVLEHDLDSKQFSAFYNNTVIEGSVYGEVELQALLDMIFAKPEVALYICRKLYRWFVYYHIDDATEANIIQPMAEMLRQNDYEILPVLEALLKSEHFYESVQTGCFIKTPVDQVIGALRTFNCNVNGTTPWDGYLFWYYATYFLSEMRMLPGDPPNVAGWQAFRQSPQYYRLWINGDSMRVRFYFTDVMIGYFLETDNDQFRFNLVDFAAQFPSVADPKALIDDLVILLFPKPLSDAKKYLLKGILLSGLPSDNYWTNAWNEYLGDPTDPMAYEVVNSRLVNLHLYIAHLPEFHLA